MLAVSQLSLEIARNSVRIRAVSRGHFRISKLSFCPPGAFLFAIGVLMFFCKSFGERVEDGELSGQFRAMHLLCHDSGGFLVVIGIFIIITVVIIINFVIHNFLDHVPNGLLPSRHSLAS